MLLYTKFKTPIDRIVRIEHNVFCIEIRSMRRNVFIKTEKMQIIVCKTSQKRRFLKQPLERRIIKLRARIVEM